MIPQHLRPADAISDAWKNEFPSADIDWRGPRDLSLRQAWPSVRGLVGTPRLKIYAMRVRLAVPARIASTICLPKSRVPGLTQCATRTVETGGRRRRRANRSRNSQTVQASGTTSYMERPMAGRGPDIRSDHRKACRTTAASKRRISARHQRVGNHPSVRSVRPSVSGSELLELHP